MPRMVEITEEEKALFDFSVLCPVENQRCYAWVSRVGGRCGDCPLVDGLPQKIITLKYLSNTCLLTRMDKQLVEIEKTTPRKIIEDERKRLISQIGTDWWRDHSRCGWAKNLYGETLTERTAEQIYEEKNHDISYLVSFSKGYCQICGENFKLDEVFILMSFSFCDEYSCGMSIHKNCKKLGKS